jgi:hypothetical protein
MLYDLFFSRVVPTRTEEEEMKYTDNEDEDSSHHFYFLGFLGFNIKKQ